MASAFVHPRVLRLQGLAGLLLACKFARKPSSRIPRKSVQGMRVMRALLAFYARVRCGSQACLRGSVRPTQAITVARCCSAILAALLFGHGRGYRAA